MQKSNTQLVPAHPGNRNYANKDKLIFPYTVATLMFPFSLPLFKTERGHFKVRKYNILEGVMVGF